MKQGRTGDEHHYFSAPSAGGDPLTTNKGHEEENEQIEVKKCRDKPVVPLCKYGEGLKRVRHLSKKGQKRQYYRYNEYRNVSAPCVRSLCSSAVAASSQWSGQLQQKAGSEVYHRYGGDDLK